MTNNFVNGPEWIKYIGAEHRPAGGGERTPSGRFEQAHIGPIRIREWPKLSKTNTARGQFLQCGQIGKIPIRRKTLHMLVSQHVCTRNRSMNSGLPSAFGTLCFILKKKTARI